MRGALAGVVLSILLTSAPAFADDADAARTAMRRGTAALENGDAATSLAEFEKAKILVPNANAPWFFAAQSLMLLERWQDAVKNLETYLEKDRNVSDAASVEAKIAEIRGRHFPGRVHVATNTPATVTVDGLGQMEVLPGRHHVEAHAAGFTPASSDVDVVGDKDLDVELVLEKIPSEAPPPKPSPPAEQASPWHTAGWITAGVGGVALVTAFVVDVTALGAKIDDYNAAATHREATAGGLRSEVQDLQRGVAVGYIGGSVLALAGLALVLFAPSTSRRMSAMLAF